MATSDQFHEETFDEFRPAQKIPDTINVLTILTFVGCGMGIISAIWSYSRICDGIPQMIQAANKLGEDSTVGKYLQDSIEVAYRQCDLKLPILLVSITCIALCAIGALMMRKLSKKGYFIYLIGELALPIATLVLVGGNLNFIFLLSFLVPVVFLIIYATQLRYMK